MISVCIDYISLEEPANLMKKSQTSSKKAEVAESSDENSSPTCKPTMMMNWLKQGSAKKPQLQSNRASAHEKIKDDVTKNETKTKKATEATNHENKSHYFGSNAQHKKSDDKVTIGESKTKSDADKRSPKEEFKKKVASKKPPIMLDDDEEDDFMMKKKVKLHCISSLTIN